MAAIWLDTWSGIPTLFSAPTEIAVYPSRFIVSLIPCLWREVFSKIAGSFIFQNVSVNVIRQSYAFAMLRAESYRQAQIS